MKANREGKTQLDIAAVDRSSAEVAELLRKHGGRQQDRASQGAAEETGGLVVLSMEGKVHCPLIVRPDYAAGKSEENHASHIEEVCPLVFALVHHRDQRRRRRRTPWRR